MELIGPLYYDLKKENEELKQRNENMKLWADMTDDEKEGKNEIDYWTEWWVDFRYVTGDLPYELNRQLKHQEELKKEKEKLIKARQKQAKRKAREKKRKNAQYQQSLQRQSARNRNEIGQSVLMKHGKFPEGTKSERQLPQK